MRAYIRENLRFILAISVILVCTGALIWTNELVAQILPVASEELTLVSCELEEDTYDYTGSQITPEIGKLVFSDRSEKEIVRFADEIRVLNYIDNIDIGKADIEVTLEGYQGSFVIKNAFLIQPAMVKNLHVTQSAQEGIDLAWDKAVGAIGYEIYKSVDQGVTFTLLYNTNSGDVTTYQDTAIQFNATFQYYVRAYMEKDAKVVYGTASDVISQITALATPVIAKATNQSYQSNVLQWSPVPGAVGYQIYRSMTKTGKYECIIEITDGNAASYTDSACECGKTYYYYMTACQEIDTQKFYGKASTIVAVKTKPNRVGISGKTTDDAKKVSLSWKQSAGAQGYELYRSVDSTSDYKLLAKIENKDTLSWADSGLDKHTSYYYRIRPYCVVDGAVVYGSYSGTYEKEAVIEYNYSAETGVDVLRQYVGRPYVFGGTSPTKGWDCSYFVQWTYKKHFGIDLPRSSIQQASGGKKVSVSNRSEWRPGDLIFYKTNNGKGAIGHVAVYLGNGQIIHALSKRHKTLIQDVDVYETWDENKLYCVRRYF